MASLTNVTDFSFDPEVLKCDIPVLAHFWAEWSGPARQLLPRLEQLAAAHGQQVKVVNVEIESNPTVTSAYNVLTLPTLLLFKNGQELVRLAGPQEPDAILAAIQPYFDQ
ncbi:MAG: thioredoxin TrxA [Anaerolineae bacterium]